MATDDEEPSGSALPPDEAFGLLGDETRMEILHALATAGDVLSFSSLYDRVDVRDSGQFNYHLDKLQGHFVEKTDEGYNLTRAGDRVIQAVFSGAITETPVMEPTEIEKPCIYCGASTLISSRGGRVRHYCSACTGTYGLVSPDSAAEIGSSSRDERDELGLLGQMRLPPAGIQGRTPGEVFETTFIWGTLELLAMGRGVCPRCSATVDRSVRCCDDHDTEERVCEQCGSRYAALCKTHCANCTFRNRAPIVLLCLGDPAVMTFLTANGVDPLEDWSMLNWSEEVTGTDPFEGRFTCSLGDDAVTLVVDETVTVNEVVSTQQ